MTRSLIIAAACSLLFVACNSPAPEEDPEGGDAAPAAPAASLPPQAALEAEWARMLQLAKTGRYAQQSAGNLAELETSFAARKTACGTDAACLTTAYGTAIADLRTGFADARGEGGVSDGPTPVRCQGLDYLLSATFINTDPGILTLQYLEKSVVLNAAPSGSGARYVGEVDGQETTFWTQGEEARFDPPGEQVEVTCAFEETG